ncbi:hypothetical protein FYL58_09755 [Klebsiella aerogenes]|nr:hypothetical protein [Klebsiella aerogenes]EIW9497850.1 hypothetical protein [Klebsiella aerogenes]KLF24170.1 hypothetical protein YA28_01350 [Klebsiella aerogenes]KUQ19314.1 hypothetical protein AWI09_10570 [Klebsiella aerogenes]KUR20131.1 hypothetical protein AWI35_23695 [Klebsiella aerogenes]
MIPYFFIIKEAGWLALNDEHPGLQPSAVKKINNPTAIRFLQKINRYLARKLRAPEDDTSASISRMRKNKAYNYLILQDINLALIHRNALTGLPVSP